MKYSEIQTSVLQIFGNVLWTTNNIQTIPENYQGSISGAEYIRVFIVPSGYAVPNDDSASGQIIVDIYTAAGSGPARSGQIADLLDDFLSRKSIETASGLTQTGASAMSKGRPDPSNSGLYLVTYSVPFNFFIKR